MKFIGILIVFSLFLAAGLFVSLSGIRQQTKAIHLRDTGAVTEGIITDVVAIKGPSTVSYQYSVSGRIYEGRASATTLQELRKGQHIQVHYMPLEPATSSIDLEGDISNSIKLLFFSAIVLGMICLIFFTAITVYRRGNYRS